MDKAKRNLLISRIYGYIFTAVTVLVALLSIIQVWDIYNTGLTSGAQTYTPEIIASHFGKIAVPVFIWIALIITDYVLSLVFPVENKFKNTLTRHDIYKISLERIPEENRTPSLKKLRNIREILRVAAFVLIVISSVISLFYLLDKNNFLADGNVFNQARDMALSLLPWMVGTMVLICAIMYINDYLYQLSINEIRTLKGTPKKYKVFSIPNVAIIITRAVCLALGIVFIILGIFNEGVEDVLIKAINICMECIGLG